MIKWRGKVFWETSIPHLDLAIINIIALPEGSAVCIIPRYLHFRTYRAKSPRHFTSSNLAPVLDGDGDDDGDDPRHTVHTRSAVHRSLADHRDHSVGRLDSRCMIVCSVGHSCLRMVDLESLLQIYHLHSGVGPSQSCQPHIVHEQFDAPAERLGVWLFRDQRSRDPYQVGQYVMNSFWIL